MAYNVFVLDSSKAWFLEQGRIDPMTRRQFRAGDSVVVCDSCKMVFLESTWDDCGGKCVAPGCNGRMTGLRFLSAPPPKPRTAADGLNRIVLTNNRVVRRDGADSNGSPTQMIIKRVNNH